MDPSSAEGRARTRQEPDQGPPGAAGSESALDPQSPAGPWFQQNPRLAMVIAVALFAGIFALRMRVGGPEDVISMLYALPIALIAIAFGFRGGLAAGVAGSFLIALWAVISSAELTPLGWTSRITPLLLLGVLLGLATDRLRDAERQERRAVILAAQQREAAEINDSILQGLTSAKWRLESGELDKGLDIVIETMGTTQALVDRLLGSDSLIPGDRRRSQLPPR